MKSQVLVQCMKVKEALEGGTSFHYTENKNLDFLCGVWTWRRYRELEILGSPPKIKKGPYLIWCASCFEEWKEKKKIFSSCSFNFDRPKKCIQWVKTHLLYFHAWEYCKHSKMTSNQDWILVQSAIKIDTQNATVELKNEHKKKK